MTFYLFIMISGCYKYTICMQMALNDIDKHSMNDKILTCFHPDLD